MSLAVIYALLAVWPLFDGGEVSLVYALLTVLNVGLAVFYRVYPHPIDDPDAPAPPEWFKLAGLLTVVLVGAMTLLVVVG